MQFLYAVHVWETENKFKIIKKRIYEVSSQTNESTGIMKGGYTNKRIRKNYAQGKIIAVFEIQVEQEKQKLICIKGRNGTFNVHCKLENS